MLSDSKADSRQDYWVWGPFREPCIVIGQIKWTEEEGTKAWAPVKVTKRCNK